MTDYTKSSDTVLNKAVSELVFDDRDLWAWGDSYSPYTGHLEHAFSVVNEMLRKGYDYDIYSVSNFDWEKQKSGAHAHHVRFTWLQDFEPSICAGVGNVSDNGSGDWWWGFTSTSLPNAICVAALQAITQNARPQSKDMTDRLKKKHSGSD